MMRLIVAVLFVHRGDAREAPACAGCVTPQVWADALESADALINAAPAQHQERCSHLLNGQNRVGFSQAWQDWCANALGNHSPWAGTPSLVPG
eukprot:2339622-Prymnesium_polylepis.2